MNATRTSCRRAVYCLALTVGLIDLPMRAQSSRPEKIATDTARPIVQVLNELEAKYGWQLTYEDPPYEATNDLVDVSDVQFLREHPGNRRLSPAAKPFEFHFEVPIDGVPEKETILGELLRSHELVKNPGIFAVSHTGAISHIEPAKLLTREGRMVATHSILDYNITFPQAQRTSLEAFQMVLSSLTAATGIRISQGIIAVNLLSQTTSTEGPQNEPAKAVLVRIFEDVNRRVIGLINEPRRIVWQIMYEPDSKTYFFNMHVVTIEERTPLGGTRRKPI